MLIANLPPANSTTIGWFAKTAIYVWALQPICLVLQKRQIFEPMVQLKKSYGLLPS